MRKNKLDMAVKNLAEWKQWILDHGLTQAGYVRHYGDPILDRWYHGQGGSAIFAADVTNLACLIGLEKEAKGRTGHFLQPEDLNEALRFASDTSWMNPKTIVRHRLSSIIGREPTQEEIDVSSGPDDQEST